MLLHSVSFKIYYKKLLVPWSIGVPCKANQTWFSHDRVSH